MDFWSRRSSTYVPLFSIPDTPSHSFLPLPRFHTHPSPHCPPCCCSDKLPFEHVLLCIQDESGSMRKNITADLKSQMLQAIYETEWKRGVLARLPASSTTTTSTTASTPASAASAPLTASGATTLPGTTVPAKKGPFPEQVCSLFLCVQCPNMCV